MKDPLRVYRQLFNNNTNIKLLKDFLEGNKIDDSFLNKISEHKDAFKLEDNKLFYDDLEILLSKDKEKALKAELKRFPFVNKQTFYKNIIAKNYLNITREQTNNVYLGVDINAISRKPLRPTKKQITSNKDGMYAIDLIEFSENISKFNKRYRHILNVVNIFTRYTMLVGLTSKKPEILYKKFLESIEEHNIQFKSIKIILMDNRTEFSVLKTELSQRGVKIIQSPTYSPQSNSIVERRNQEIRNRQLLHVI
jgi:IS30 family transposase